MNQSADPDPSASTGQRVDAGKGRIFPCESCGADLEFSIGVQQLECPFCGFQRQIEIGEDEEVAEQDLRGTLQRQARRRQEQQPAGTSGELQEVRCDACGANVQFQGTLTSTECPYCTSPIQRDAAHVAEARIPVDGVLPFRVPNAKAAANLRHWVKSRWFLPNDLKRRGVSGKFQGVYLPYWTFDAHTANRYHGRRGEHYTVTVGSGKNRRTETRTRWYPASGAFQRFFDDVLVVAGEGLPRQLLRRLEPWPLAETMPFNQQVLAGYLARTYDVELGDGFTRAQERIRDELTRDVRRRIGGDVQEIHSLKTRYGGLTFKHLLLPVWLMAYRYKNKSYQVAVNAGTGEVQGQRPYSWIKIALVVVAALAVIGVIVLVAQS